MIVLIDNYDSFSYNLYQLIGARTPDIEVVRNDALTVGELAARRPSAIVLSPGPGRPCDAGICEDVVRELGRDVPMLGVCLGHQAICEAFGARIGHAKRLMHGKASAVELDASSPLFAHVASPAQVARYHSLSVEEHTLPECLRVTARADDGEVMAVEHASWPVFGVQFHPESVMTPDGGAMIDGFLDVARRFAQA